MSSTDDGALRALAVQIVRVARHRCGAEPRQSASSSAARYPGSIPRPIRILKGQNLLTDAQPLLARIAWVLHEAKLDAVMIGNAAAALHGAPVTTLDVDFFFRDTPSNRKKLAPPCSVRTTR